ncbi:MAG: helix-turn-helix domain-containing protein [Nitrospirae bacterium]|nr:helix-turn-helix domain-containing protein [Nitrospirota bacterium]
MLSPAQCLAVWDAIRALPSEDRPQQVRHLFDLVITHIEVNTGLVTLTREELAKLIGTEPKHISTMMGTLEDLGVISRERVKVAGMRGAGVARYRVNAHVAWNGKLEIRAEKAKQEPLPFGVVQGGKA